MSIALDSVSSSFINNSGSGSMSFNHTLGQASGNNRIVIVGVGTEGGGNVTGITYNGQAMTFLLRETRSSNIAELWYILDASLPSAAGTYAVNVSMTNSGTGCHIMAGAQSFTGAEQTAPEVTASKNVGANTISTSIVTQTADAWVVDVVCGSDMGTWTASGSGQTEQWDRQAGSTTSAAGSTNGPVSSPTTVTHTWTPTDATTARIAHALCSIAPESGGSSSSSSRSSSSSSCKSSSSSCSSRSSSCSSSSSSSIASSSSSSCRSSSCSSSSRSSSSSSSSSVSTTATGAGRQAIFAGTSYGLFGTPRYNTFMAVNSHSAYVAAWSFSQTEHLQIVPTSGTMKKFAVRVDTAPGSGNSYTFLVQKNDVDTALSVTISGSNLTGYDAVNEIVFAAGDRINIKATWAGSPPAAPGVYWGAEFNSSQPNESIILGNVHDEVNRTAGTEFSSLVGGNVWSSVESNKTFVVPTAGFLKKLAVNLFGGGPGTGNTKTFSVVKNGVATSLAVALTGSTGSGIDSVNSVPVVAGDLISFQHTHVGPGTGLREARWGVVFQASTPGEYIIPTQGYAPSDTAVNYLPVCAADSTWVAVGTIRKQLSGAITSELKKLYVKLENAPGPGNSRTFVLRNNTIGSDTALSVTISGSDTEGFIEADVSVGLNELIVYKHTPSGTPTPGRAWLGMVGFFPAIASSSSSSSRSSSSSSRSSSSSSSQVGSSSSCSSSCRSSSSCSSSSCKSSSCSCSSSSSQSSSSSSFASADSSSSSSCSSSSSTRTDQESDTGWADRRETQIL